MDAPAEVDPTPAFPTASEVRAMADVDLLSFQKLGAASVRDLRRLFGTVA